MLKSGLDMVNKILSAIKKNRSEKLTYKEDLLTKLGREQLTQMIERGIELPVAPLK